MLQCLRGPLNSLGVEECRWYTARGEGLGLDGEGLVCFGTACIMSKVVCVRVVVW